MSWVTTLPVFGIESDRKEKVLIESNLEGSLAYRGGDLNSAITALESSINLQPNLTDKFNLAILYGKRYQQDVRLLQQAERVGNSLDAAHLSQKADADRAAALQISETFLGRGDWLEVRMLLLQAQLAASDNKREFVYLWQQLEPQPQHAYIAMEAAEVYAEPEFLETAIAIARRTGDIEALAFAIVEQDTPTQAELRQAVLGAQEAGNHLLAARGLLKFWEMQGGDWHYLQQAYTSLQEYRKQITPLDSLTYFPQIEKIHRLYIQELLDRQQFDEVLAVAEGLAIAEVESLVLADCTYLEDANYQGTIVRYIVQPEETWAFVVQNGSILSTHKVEISQEDLEAKTHRFFLELTTYGNENFIRSARELHELLIAPISQDLKGEGLIIVPDQSLRTIPFAVFYDGERFLVERFAIATGLHHAISSTSFDLESGAFLGVPEHSELPSLPWVEYEAESSQLPVQLTQEVTLDSLRKHIRRNPSVLHIATHGRFYGSPNRSQLSLSDGSISALQFERLLIGSRIDLLVLAACQTAIGDEQASLGFHALALRARVQRVLGSAWAFRELEGSGIMKIFYEGLQAGLTPEAALREAQVAAIDRQMHPVGWGGLQVFVR